ncbi:ATP-binding protein [Enterovirga sp.]|uniref:ATP-binding protein n=1 Tax=Enterovirga sp. TaxID=2026350 RepID=UPI003FA59E16
MTCDAAFRPCGKGRLSAAHNRDFAEGREVFGDPVLAADRLLHRAIVIQIEGSSYRLRQQADLVPKHTLESHRHPAAGAQAQGPSTSKGKPRSPPAGHVIAALRHSRFSRHGATLASFTRSRANVGASTGKRENP